MELNDLLLTVIGISLGGLLYYKGKAGSAGALLENSDSKEKLNKEDKDIAKSSGLLEAEEEKRKALEADAAAKSAKVTDATIKDILDLFNTPK